jgi:hypothetical protein
MPIIYDEVKKGFRLDNPTEAEIKALETLAVEFVTSSLAKAAALAAIADPDSKETMQ